MNFTEKQLADLRSAVSGRLSLKRFNHTVRVENAAIKIAKRCMPNGISELRAAALLHDISKEYSVSEELEILKAADFVTDDDLLSPPVYHALTAPAVVKHDFPEFATANVLSAVLNHTTGAPDMSVFDEIIFISDYIEDGRTHRSCVEIRNALYDALAASRDTEEAVSDLHIAVLAALENTIKVTVDLRKHLNLRTVTTRNAFLGRSPMMLSARR